MRWLSRFVTFAVILTVAGAAALLIRSRMPTTKVGQAFTTWALFRDGSRLASSSPVMIAGVHVGEVSRLSVEAGLARVDMRLVDDVDIPIDSWVTKRAESAFGDSYIEIVPTTGEAGAATERRLKSGEQLIHVIEGSSTDSVLRAIGRAMPKVDHALDTAHGFMLDARRWVSGPVVAGLSGAERWLDEGHVESPLGAAEHAMERVDKGTERAASAVADAKRSIPDGITSFDHSITNARKQMADLKTGLHDALDRTRTGLDDVDKPIQQVADVVEAVDEGRGDDFKGGLGRLINDGELGESLDDGTDTIASGTASFTKFRSWLGFHAEYNIFSHIPRYYVTAEIAAAHDNFVLVELEKSQLGARPGDSLTDVAGSNTFDRAQSIDDSVRFTLEYGKRFGGWFQLRGGIKDSNFGIGADALLLGHGKLKFSADFFGSFNPRPDLKLTAALEVFRSVYLLAGIDDVLNKGAYLPIETGSTTVPTTFEKLRYGRDYFLGATLQFTDADLTTLVRVYGALLVGLLSRK